jgi:Flp pilus assembly protein TadG
MRTPLARRFLVQQAGAVAVEFVLIAPLLITLLFGIVCVGYFFGIAHSLQQLASEAARVSVNGLDAAERAALALDYLAQASTRFPMLLQDAITPQIAVSDGTLPDIRVTISYSLAGSVLDLANGFLGLELTSLSADAYLAY